MVRWFSVVTGGLMVAGTLVACSGGESGFEPRCDSRIEPAASVSGIESVEAGSLRQELSGVKADGSGGSIFLTFEPAVDGQAIDKSDLALRVRYQTDADTVALRGDRNWLDALIPAAQAATCISLSQQVRAQIVGLDVSPLSDVSALIFFEQRFVSDSGEYLPLDPDSAVDVAGYLLRAADGPVEIIAGCGYSGNMAGAGSNGGFCFDNV